MRELVRRGGLELFARPRRRRVGSLLGGIAVLAIAIGVIVGAGSPASSQGAGNTGSSGSGRSTVQRRDLIATDTQAGTLGYADARTVFNRVAGTLTWLPSVGTTIKPGQTLYKVDGAPVILFDGAVPAYRTLAAGITDGPDVAELKQNLITLGFDPGHAITVNDTFDSATTSAINGWQASHGLTQTGQITLGQVVFLSGARRISAVSGVLGSTGGGSSAGAASGSSSTGAATGTTAGASATVASTATAAPAAFTPAGPPRAELVSLTTTTAAPVTSAQSPGAVSAASCNVTSTTAISAPNCPPRTPQGVPKSAPTAVQLLAQLVAALKKLAANGSAPGSSGRTGSSGTGTTPSASAGAGRGSSAGGSSGGGAASAGGSSAGAAGTASSAASASGAATQIMQTTSAALVVTVQLDATKQSEAVIGAPVTVQLPNGNSDSGRITAVSSVAQSAASSSSGAAGNGAATGTPSATIPVTVTLTGRRRVAGLDQAAVSVNFQQQVKRGVLSVPVTALLATAGGGYAVQTVGPGQRELVPVTPGLFAGGYVEVSGSSLTEGMQVSDSQG